MSTTPTPAGSSRDTPAPQLAPSPGDVFVDHEEIDIDDISPDSSEDEDASNVGTPVLVSPVKQRRAALTLAKQPDEDVWHLEDEVIIGKLI